VKERNVDYRYLAQSGLLLLPPLLTDVAMATAVNRQQWLSPCLDTPSQQGTHAPAVMRDDVSRARESPPVILHRRDVVVKRLNGVIRLDPNVCSQTFGKLNETKISALL